MVRRGELQYPRLKHAGSRPSVCNESGASPSSSLRLSWIFKLDIKGAKSPHERALATGSQRASRGRSAANFEADLGARGDRSEYSRITRLRGQRREKVGTLTSFGDLGRTSRVSSRGIRNSAKDCGCSYPVIVHLALTLQVVDVNFLLNVVAKRAKSEIRGYLYSQLINVTYIDTEEFFFLKSAFSLRQKITLYHAQGEYDGFQ